MRNRLLLLLLSILFVKGMDAQELVVNSFRLDVLNDNASGAKAKLDNNNKPLALIMVRFAAAAPTFDGNVMGKVEEKEKNEYWVYMAAGSTMLTIYHELASPLEISFADYGIDELQSTQTYIMDLKLAQADNKYWEDSNTKILGKWTRDDISTATSQELNRENILFDFKNNGIVKYNYVHQIENRTFKAKYKVAMTGSYSIAKDSVFIVFNTFDYDDAISVRRKDGYVVTQKYVDNVKDQMSEEFRYIGLGLYRKVKLILLDKREMIFEMGNNNISSKRKQEKYIRK